jgi:hypothetical protein
VGFALSSDPPYSGVDISFLSEFSYIRYLSLSDTVVAGAHVFSYLKDLRELTLNYDQKKPIDYASMPSLAKVFLYWTPAMKTLWDSPSIKALYLYGYTGKTAGDIARLSTLQNLQLTNGPLSDFSDLSRMPNLWALGVYYHRKLETLEDIGRISGLEVLSLECCKRIEDISPLTDLTNLRVLDLMNMGDINSLEPLQPLVNLEEFYALESTKITDGDLSVLASLPKLRRVIFQNRRHYSHKLEEFPDPISVPLLDWRGFYRDKGRTKIPLKDLRRILEEKRAQGVDSTHKSP